LTESELEVFDGRHPDGNGKVYVAVAGIVFDVEAGRAFYAEGGPHHAFAGKKCTRGVALPSLEETDINDDFEDFDAGQHKKKDEWVAFFEKKYTKVSVHKHVCFEESNP
jgi:membrane-associated progesterone receptor component